MHRDERNRRPGQRPTAPEATHTDQARVTTRIADDGDTATPREVGELLQTWLGIQLDTVDDLVAEARDKAAAIPDQRQLWMLFGEALVRLHCLELEVAGLRADVAQLRQRQRGRAA